MTNDDKEERRDVSEERIEAMSELVVVLEEYLATRRSKEASHLPPSEPEAANAGYAVSQRDLASRLAGHHRLVFPMVVRAHSRRPATVRLAFSSG